MNPAENQEECVIEAFGNNKGGVGKTTLAIQRSLYKAVDQGKKTLVVDLDPQGSTSFRLLKQDMSGKPVYEGISTQQLWQPVDIDELELVENGAYPGLTVIYATSGDGHLRKFDHAADATLQRFVSNLFELIDANDFEAIIVDTPPSDGLLTTASICIADKYYIPVELQFNENTREIISNIKRIKKNNPSLPIELAGLIINKYTHTPLEVKELEDLKETLGNLAMNTVIKELIAITRASHAGIYIKESDDGKKSNHQAVGMISDLMAEMDIRSGYSKG